MELTQQNICKLNLFQSGFAWCAQNRIRQQQAAVLGLCTIPRNSPVLQAYPAATRFVAWISRYGSATLDINSQPFIFNGVVNGIVYYTPMIGWYYEYHHKYYNAVDICWPVYSISQTQPLISKALPSSINQFLRHDFAEAGDSTAGISVELLGWSYNELPYSVRAVFYCIKVVEGGRLGEAKIVWTKIPYVVPDFVYVKPSTFHGTFYSESFPFWRENQTIATVSTIESGSTVYALRPPFVNGIWCESRRRTPETKDVMIFMYIENDKRTLKVSETPYWFPPEKIFEWKSEFDLKQATWCKNRIILLADTSPYYKLYVLDLDGTLTYLATTSIPNTQNVLLVAHPNQDVAYLLGNTEQWIIDTDDMTFEVVNYTLTNLNNFDALQFDVDGYVWFNGSKRNKYTLEQVLNISNAKCNFTYVAQQVSSSVYKAYTLNGEELSNIPSAALSSLFLSGLAYRYPQRVLVPYNETDLRLFSRNGNLSNPAWYGWDGSKWVDYNGSNEYLIENEEVMLEDGVKLEFDFSYGKSLVAGEYIYFAVADGIIKTSLNEIKVNLVYDTLYWEYNYIDIPLTIYNLQQNSNGTYSYILPQSSEGSFIELQTFLMRATFDDPEQNGSGVNAVIITSGVPQQGQVLVESRGKFTFNAADIGRTFQCHFYIVRDPESPFQTRIV